MSYIVIYCLITSFIVIYLQISAWWRCLVFSCNSCIFWYFMYHWKTSIISIGATALGVYFEWRIVCLRTSIITFHERWGRFPRVFGEEFCDKFGDEFSESPNLVMNWVENFVTNLVIHQNLWRKRWQIWWHFWWQFLWKIVWQIWWHIKWLNWWITEFCV